MNKIPQGFSDKNKFKIGQRVRIKYVTASENPRFVGEIATVKLIDSGPYHYRLTFENQSKIYKECENNPEMYNYHSDQLTPVNLEPDENGNLY